MIVRAGSIQEDLLRSLTEVDFAGLRR